MNPSPSTPSLQAYVLGLLGVTIFALTFPMTRLAVGTVDAPQLSPWFSAMGRAAVAGFLSLFYLPLTHKKDTLHPSGADWSALAIVSVCIVFGFPLLTTLALREVESIHASVLYGILPLTTAAIGAMHAGTRLSMRFWGWALLGAALVVGYGVVRSPTGFSLQRADVWLILAMLFAAYGYARGAKISQKLGPERVICWVLVISLPITLPAMLFTAPNHAISSVAWLGFAYVSLFSMWLGFFAWYRALAVGGTVKISQIQLLQPFMSMVFSVPILGERLDLLTLVFGVSVLFTVWMGKKST